MSRRLVQMLGGIVLAAATVAFGQGRPGAKFAYDPIRGTGTIYILPVGSVPAQIVSNLVAVLPDTFYYRTVALKPVPLPAATNRLALDDLRQIGAETAPADAKRVLVVAAVPLTGPQGQNVLAFFEPQGKVVVMSLAGLDLEDKAGVGDAALVALRPRKVAAHGLGLSFGLPVCPNPHCALHEYGPLQELDRIAAQLCPPQMGQMEEIADRDAPRNEE